MRMILSRIIFDVSGGDMANEILSYLDFQTIAYEKKAIFGDIVI